MLPIPYPKTPRGIQRVQEGRARSPVYAFCE